MFIDLFIYQYLINISPCIRMASSGTLNERWRLCIEDATRSIWRHELVVQTQSIGVFLNVQIVCVCETRTMSPPTPTINPLTPTQKHHQQSSHWHSLVTAGHKGETIINKMRKHINKTIPNTNATKIQIIQHQKTRFKIQNQRLDEKRTPPQSRLPSKMSWLTVQL